MQGIPDIKRIDRSGWKKFRFDQIASNINEHIEPKDTNLECYVGLEHLDPDTIHIKRKGKPTDVEGTKLRFYKGDVIFGRRRAYQRKAALTEYDGICSAHALVLRANPDAIDPKLFPFFLHSDLFMHRAIDISVGSLSPTINWGTLKHQEFLLPTKDQQAKFADLFWAGDAVYQSELELFRSISSFFERYLNDLVSGAIKGNNDSWNTYKLSDLGSFFSGLSGKNKNDFGEGAPFITYMNIFSNRKIDPALIGFVKINEGEKQNQVNYGDIFFTGSSETPEEVGMSSVLLDNIPNCYLNSFCFGFRLNDFSTLLPEYASFYLRSQYVRSFMSLHAQGYTRYNLSKSTVSNKLEVRLPRIERQKEIVKELDNVEHNLIVLNEKLEKSQLILKKLMNQIFV